MLDILIIGAGPAGLGAALYACRSGLNVEVLESIAPGGQLASTSQVENYLGFESIDGIELSMKFLNHVSSYGIEIKYEAVLKVTPDSNGFIVTTNLEIYHAKALIITTGAQRKLLNIDGESRLTGRGVSYCASCDGNFFKGKTAAVNGGGNTAVEDAEYLARLCSKVYVIHRRDSFRASKILVDRLKTLPNVELILDSVIDEILGSDKVESLKIRNLKTNLESSINVDGVFVAIGTIPVSDFTPSEIKRDSSGYIFTDEHNMTNIKGIFAAGDVRHSPLKQIITAVADGAVAADGAAKYLEEKI